LELGSLGENGFTGCQPVRQWQVQINPCVVHQASIMPADDKTEGPGTDHTEQVGCFQTTHWSVVLTAGQSQAPQADSALENLCRAYWSPLYAYVRRQGHTPHDAQDMTQEFLARLLAKKYLKLADRERGSGGGSDLFC
jgi:hypothetical protein